MRKSTLLFVFLTFNLLLLFSALLHAGHERERLSRSIQAKEELVRSLSLTDLCLFTEARYTRHPALADLHTPFQDHPLSLEHFPSGSLIAPPAGGRGE
jgi:hypothetical protein